MEQLLHYTWKYKFFPLKELTTTTGQLLEVIDCGQANTNAGPDFFNAKIKLDGVLWVGNIEIHRSSSDWFKHGHHTNPVYDSVILHSLQPSIRKSSGAMAKVFLNYSWTVRIISRTTIGNYWQMTSTLHASASFLPCHLL